MSQSNVIKFIEHAGRDNFGTLTRVQNYSIADCISFGANNRVYRAIDINDLSETMYILKRIPIDSAKVSDQDIEDDRSNVGNDDPSTALDAMFSEIGILRYLSHPNIIKLHSVFLETSDPNDIYLCEFMFCIVSIFMCLIFLCVISA